MRVPIRWKLLVWTVAPILVVYLVVMGVTVVLLQRQARDEVEKHMLQLTAHHAARFDGRLREVARIARSTATFLETAPDLDESQLRAQLRANIGQSPLVYGAAIAFERGQFASDGELFCPYVFRAGDELREMDIARDGYDYTEPQWTWWHGPKDTGRATWTDPYFDEGAGDVLMTTCAVPFFRDGVFRGVATVDIHLPTLREHLGDEVAEVDFEVLLPDGRYVYAADPDKIMNRTVFDSAEAAGRADLTTAARRVLVGTRGVEIVEGWSAPEREWVFHAPIESTGWRFIAWVSEREVLAAVRTRLYAAAGALALTLALMITGIWLVSGHIARPIARLTKTARRIASGELDAQAEEPAADDEVRDLARTFNHMTEELRGHMERRAKAEALTRDAVIFAMAKLTESRDDDTGAHLERICRYTEILGRELEKRLTDIDDGWVETISVTAALHDIGKVGIPDAVLKKPGRLTDDERTIIQKHTTIGGDTLMDVKRQLGDDTFLRTATEIAFAHHERWDGAGYPFGLKGEDIALSARIVALADVYDALTSVRVYKAGMTHEEAKAIIVDGSGRHFDPQVVDAFLATEETFRDTHRRLQPVGAKEADEGEPPTAQG